MAFGLWIGRPRRLLEIWPFFLDRTWHWIPSLPRLIGRSPVGGVETRELGSSEDHIVSIEHGKVCSNTRNAQGQFISNGITGIVELLDDGTALKSPFPDSEIESHVLDIAKEATIHRRIGPHKRTRFFLPRRWADQPTVLRICSLLDRPCSSFFKALVRTKRLLMTRYKDFIENKNFLMSLTLYVDRSSSKAGYRKLIRLHRYRLLSEISFPLRLPNVDCSLLLDGLDTGKDMLIDHVGSPKHIVHSRPLFYSASSVLSKK